MSDDPGVARLSDRQILLVLGYLTEDMREQVDDAAGAAPTSEAEARAVLASFLAASGHATAVDLESIVPNADAIPLGRELLTMLLQDEASVDAAREHVDHPPEDSQMSIELAIGAAVVLGLLITWLQTKVEIHASREGGETSWSFNLHKEATDPDTISEVAATVSRFIDPHG
jgi:hypothetical protein